jgi:hypothetical protein
MKKKQKIKPAKKKLKNYLETSFRAPNRSSFFLGYAERCHFVSALFLTLFL